MTPASIPAYGPNRRRFHHFEVVLLCFATVLSLSYGVVEADEVPAFFLKIAKNIPRVGRSGKFEDFFFKSAKNIPRIGRRDGSPEFAESWTTYKDDAPHAEPSKRRMNYPSIDPAEQFSWQHFPLAIEGPRELWRTLAGYSKDTSDDIDNEIWQRKKRTEDPSGNSATN